MPCPICGLPYHQYYIGKLGAYTVVRCGGCGYQYYGDCYDDNVEVDYSKKPVRSSSEWGSFRYDGDKDMKVLRKRAEGAVRYFNNGKPRVDMETHIFGYPFSIIDNGRLLDNEKAYKGNVIIRALSYHENGVFAGNVTLSYNDDYNDGRGQGGSGAIILDKVTNVRIDGDYLVITGIDGRTETSYRYLIQEHEDAKPFVQPIPKGQRVPPEVPVPRTSKPIDPKQEKKPKRIQTKLDPEPRTAPKQEPRTVPKEKPKTVQKKPALTKKRSKEQVYEVRVGGSVEGSFSSKAKAEALKRELKSKGIKARIRGVFCRCLQD